MNPSAGSLAFLHCSSECHTHCPRLEKHFGRLWTCVTASHSMAARPRRFKLLGDGVLVSAGFIFKEAAEVLVRFATNTRKRLVACCPCIGASISSNACGVDGDKGDTCRRNHSPSPHVPYFVSHCKVPCQDQAPHTLQILIQVVGRMLPSRCRRRFSLAWPGASSAFRNGCAKTAPFFERSPLGASTTVTPAWTGPWLRLDLGPARYRECWFHRCFQPIVAISLDVTGPGQPRLDSGSPPAGWFPMPDAVVGAFGLPPICPPAVRLRCPLTALGSR